MCIYTYSFIEREKDWLRNICNAQLCHKYSGEGACPPPRLLYCCRNIRTKTFHMKFHDA